MKFKIVGGAHVIRKDGENIYYNNGDVIESEEDLSAKFGKKFQRLYNEEAKASDSRSEEVEVEAELEKESKPKVVRRSRKKKETADVVSD